MNEQQYREIAKGLGLQAGQVKSTLELLAEGCTLPFIARYRKERTGSLDEVQIATIQKEHIRATDLSKRKQAVKESIAKQDKLSADLDRAIEACPTMAELEDLYLPYKQKRKTRAVAAKEKGLEPLANRLLKQSRENPEQLAVSFLTHQVASVDEALQGARDIIAEQVNESPILRSNLRNLFKREAVITSTVVKGKEAEGEKYADYFDFEELLRKCPSHRLMAMVRGEKAGFLRLKVAPPEDRALELAQRLFVKGQNPCAAQVELAIADSYKRLLQPSLDTEFANIAKEKADEEAIRVFANNLQQLLLSAPLGPKRVLGIDPGFRTGCKLVCIDEKGDLLHNETIYPHPPQGQAKQAMRKISTLLDQYKIEAIAIGNGTAGRETEQLIERMKFNKDLLVFVVSEAGASVYSASKVAREEFPDYDVTVRGAVSIGRRLIDPLAELVKIDPKSIGVGQYQHDVDQKKLKQSLDTVVESCVNRVGVNVNTASKHLLTYVSGLGPTLAQNIVDYRSEHGHFRSRREFLKVPRLGGKAFEQCAGFLRIPQADNQLDNTAVHPEAYEVVQRMAKDAQVQVQDLVQNKQLLSELKLENYLTDAIGLPTLKDIVAELEKPGRDPRAKAKVFAFDATLQTIKDLKEGAVLPGLVTNVTNFGAFVDIGIKENGLVHISNITDRFISDPAEILAVGQEVKVKVLAVDMERKRIQLSMKGLNNE